MIKDKIKTREALKKIVSRLKKERKTVVFTNGCFDILHAGHVTYLEEAKKEGDILIVALNSDSSVRTLKGRGRPVVNQNERSMVLAALDSVDFVTVFEEDDPAAIIKALGPDVIVKGADWRKDEIIGGDYVKKSGGRVATAPIYKGLSTTSLIKKIKRLR